MNDAEKQSRLLPSKPGVYLFRDGKGNILYVGKSSNLHSRVRSYFTSKSLTPKLRSMVSKTAEIDFILADNEQEALILESNLIKKYKPYYNVSLRDDKSYPYLKITLAEDWPRIWVTRRLIDDGSRYFGPYASASSLRQTLDLLNKLFPFRTCKKSITGNDRRPCLKYHIKRCSGPCIGAINREEYQAMIEQVILFISGKQEQVVHNLKKQMSRASASLEFEKAASLRDQIHAIERIMEQQKVVSIRKINADVIAIAQRGNTAIAQVFFIRGGKLIGQEHFVLEGTQDEPITIIVSSFIEQFYESGAEVPHQILLQIKPEDQRLLEEWLSSKRGGTTHLLAPVRGQKRQLVTMATENATELLEQYHIQWLADTGKTKAALEELKTQLQLPHLPRRIECYDISNIRGTAAVGSMVVFTDGKPKPALYRRFKIKSVDWIDDYAMMQEVLGRRFAGNLKAKGLSDSKEWGQIPDLILIDGGRGHLNAILNLLQGMNVEFVPVAAIAKENEEVFTPQAKDPIALPRNSQALFLLQRIRDEAHRFAVSYHTKVRKRASLTSSLDQIPGIGPKRKKALIKAFGSIKGIREASVDELAAVPGITMELAKRVKSVL